LAWNIAFTSKHWGSLAAFEPRQPLSAAGRQYGISGNSFVAIVEFGPKVRAWAVSTGGASGHPDSRHFADQVQRYIDGRLRPVYLYPDQLKGHIERVYRPGM
jgi:acyl-homoserine-lactone acylase